MDQIADSQVSFGVKQSHPRNLDEAVAVTLELESFKNIKPAIKVAQAQLDVQPLVSDVDETRVIGAVGPPVSQRMRGTSEELLQAVLTRLDRLESSLPKPRKGQPQKREPQPPHNGQQNHETNGAGHNPGSQPGKIICRKCGKEGHMLEDVPPGHLHANRRETNSFGCQGLGVLRGPTYTGSTRL